MLPRFLHRGEHQESHGTGENGTVKGIDERKGEPMNHDTSKTSRAAAPLDVKPDLVKRIGNTTFDIHIHFSETSRETLHTEMGNYTLNSGDALVFDSSVKHTYINEQDVMLTFMVVNFYPN